MSKREAVARALCAHQGLDWNKTSPFLLEIFGVMADVAIAAYEAA